MQILKKIMDYSTRFKAVKQLPWAHDLDAKQDLAAIEYATQQLTADLKNGLFQNHQQLEAFLSADEKTHIIAERVTADYLETDHIDLDHEEHIANTMFLYHRQIYAIYLTLIRVQETIDQQTMITMLLRAINTATRMIKWRYYEYQNAPTNVWLQISKLYKMAEKDGLTHVSMELYPAYDEELGQNTQNDHVLHQEHHNATTISAAYIKACMLGTLESLSFKPQQIELACKVIDHWSARITIDNAYDAQRHYFSVDTSSNSPAKRIRKFKASENARYWSLDAINSKIELCLNLLEFNIAPKQEKINELTNCKYALITFSALRAEWSRADSNRQRRSIERVTTSKAANITYGFESTCDLIKHDESIQEAKVVYQKKDILETQESSQSIKGRAEPNIIYVDLSAGQSNIVDESHKGFGLQVRKKASELNLGMMVGVSNKEKNHDIKLGVIRNLKPIAGNQIHIGVELLSRAAFCAEAENMSQKFENTTSANEFSDTFSSFNNDLTSFTCLFLPKEFSTIKQETLIVPRYQYNKKSTFKVHIAGRDVLVKFTDTLEQHENWVRVKYKLAMM